MHWVRTVLFFPICRCYTCTHFLHFLVGPLSDAAGGSRRCCCTSVPRLDVAGNRPSPVSKHRAIFRVDVKSRSIQSSALDGGECLALCSGCLTLGERDSGSDCLRMVVGPQKSCRRRETNPCHPVTSLSYLAVSLSSHSVCCDTEFVSHNFNINFRRWFRTTP